jgi:hypothetical protein
MRAYVRSCEVMYNHASKHTKACELCIDGRHCEQNINQYAKVESCLSVYICYMYEFTYNCLCIYIICMNSRMCYIYEFTYIHTSYVYICWTYECIHLICIYFIVMNAYISYIYIYIYIYIYMYIYIYVCVCVIPMNSYISNVYLYYDCIRSIHKNVVLMNPCISYVYMLHS